MNTSLKTRTPLVAAIAIAAALVTAACGGGSSSKASGDSSTTAPDNSTVETTSVSSTKASATGDLSTAFDHIAGYELAELPASVLEGARQQYQNEVSGNSLAQQAVKDINGRTVSKEGNKVAIVLGMSFNPDLSSQPGFQEGFVSGAAGNDSSPVTLSGESATTFTQTDGTVGVVFAKDRLGLLVIGAGGSSTDLQDIMSKLIGNNT
jgi:hypothetical protein